MSDVTAVLIVILIVLLWKTFCRVDGYRSERSDSGYDSSSVLDYGPVDTRTATSNITATQLMPIAGQSIRTNYFTNKKPLNFTPGRDDSNNPDANNSVGGTNFQKDSFDVISGPVYWRNDPRDVVGLTKPYSFTAPLGNENSMQALIDYEHF